VVDRDEPERLARAAARFKLRHVCHGRRGRFADGGASVFAECLDQLRDYLPDAVVEVLTPDFNGDTTSLDIVVGRTPDIFNHNLETVNV